MRTHLQADKTPQDSVAPSPASQYYTLIFSLRDYFIPVFLLECWHHQGRTFLLLNNSQCLGTHQWLALIAIILRAYSGAGPITLRGLTHVIVTTTSHARCYCSHFQRRKMSLREVSHLPSVTDLINCRTGIHAGCLGPQPVLLNIILDCE